MMQMDLGLRCMRVQVVRMQAMQVLEVWMDEMGGSREDRQL